MDTGGGCDDQVGGLNRASALAAESEEFCIDACRLRIERKNASIKILTEDRMRHCFEFGASPTGWHDRNAGKDFSLAYGSDEQRP